MNCRLISLEKVCTLLVWNNFAKFFSQQIKKRAYKILGTSVIYNSMSPYSLHYFFTEFIARLRTNNLFCRCARIGCKNNHKKFWKFNFTRNLNLNILMILPFKDRNQHGSEIKTNSAKTQTKIHSLKQRKLFSKLNM